jgi:hypothetical protein
LLQVVHLWWVGKQEDPKKFQRIIEKDKREEKQEDVQSFRVSIVATF